MQKFLSLAILSKLFLKAFPVNCPTPFGARQVLFCKYRRPAQIKNKFIKDESFSDNSLKYFRSLIKIQYE